MRAGVWCGVAVTLLFVASDAIRTVQGDGISRTNRRTSTDRSANSLNKTEENIPTYRSRSIRRREETQESSTVRSRNRGTTLEKDNILPKVEIQVESGQNDPFESRRSSIRSRSRTIGRDVTTESILSKESIIRGRSRGSGRKFTPTTTPFNDQPESSSNRIAVTLSPRSVEIKSDITKTNEILPTAATAPSNQFRRRSSTVSTVEDSKQIRPRGRINTRTNSRALDLEVAGTTNTFIAAAKQTTVTRISDGRNSRKLRYKSRTLETDTNITGVGITTLNEVEKSSQRNDITNQPEFSETNSTTSKATENTFQTSTEAVLTSSTLKSSKVVRRPITRSNGYLKSSEVKSNSKMSDEISEDDNYPESFKALIQAKNATQANSSIDESLSVKATHNDSKTHALSIQTNTTDPGTDKNSRLRKKLRIEEQSKKADEQEALSLGLTTTTTTAESTKPRSIPFRPRGTYLSRSKKPNATKSTTENINNVTRPSLENPYKFSKRIKSSTEPSRTDNTLKTKRLDTMPKKQVIRSSLFSRKNDPVNKNITVIPLNENRKHDRVQSGSNVKGRRTLPNTRYYSRLRNNTKLYLTETSYLEKNTETPIADKKVGNSADVPLIFTYLNGPSLSDKLKPTIENTAPVLNSKESQENSTENEIVNKAEESENKLIINTDVTTPKYHANYKENMQREKVITSATPAIRNIKTRKYARKQEKAKDQGTNTPSVIFKSRDRNVRKYGDTFSKTTESPANSILQEPEKPKHKFSSKYRGSYLDRPFYKPTVPTVTPSTTVEGEEIQLGPDMNAIAITKTHRPLSSANLRLSESLAKPLQVLNVEVSQHSPSVTVSIFDALAEILTSTPKPRISTTAETLPKNINEINIMHSLDGVSSNVNVNTVTGFASQESVTSTDNLNTNAKFVQTTEPVVFNSLLVGDNVTPSLKAEDEKTSFFTSPKTVPIPIPTTPISARKPFAIKVLYSETESTSKNSPTAMPTTRLTSTDKSTMVYNSISDLLLSNNGIVSTGLTSMLSNNIRSIIDSMDDESKSRLSVGMTNLLNTLTPSVINNISKVEDDSTSYMTTPYSLEDINDTANIDINESSNTYNKILQNVSPAEIIVNTETLLNSQTEVDIEGTTPVNSFDLLENVQNLDSDLNFKSNVLINTLKDTESTTARVTVDNIENLDETSTNKELVTPSILDPLRDITTETSNTQLQSPSLAKLLSSNQLDDSEVLENPSQVSQLQLWVLSKKARVLKMIEDLLRMHSDEISNPPLGIRNKPKISFPNRLTEIMNTMNFTTTEPDFTERTTLNFIESNSSSTSIVPFTSTLSLDNNLNGDDFVLTTQNIDGIIFTNDESSTKTVSEIADAFTTANSVPTTTESEDIVTTSNSKEIENEKFELASTTTSNFETVTGIAEPRIVVDRTIMINVEDTSTSGIQTTTASVINESKSADFITNSNMLNVATRPSIPKKDFVIFGILPNNTVVRKDPNDNPLEALTEASPYIIYGVLPNNTIIRKFPNGTRVPQIMQKIDVLPISPWSLKNPYSPIHNIPAIVRPQSNPIRVSTNTVISTDIPNNEKEISLTTDTVNNLQVMIPSSALNIKDSSSLGITTTSTLPPAEKSTASHVLSLRTTTMLPSVDEILLNSISLATKEEMVISSMTSSTPEPRILTLDIDPETKQIRTEKPNDGTGNTVFKFIPIEDVTVPSTQETNVLKLATPKTTQVTTAINTQTVTISGTTEVNTQTPQIQMNTESNTVATSTIDPFITTPVSNSEKVNDEPPTPIFMNESELTTEAQNFKITDLNNDRTTFTPEQTTIATTTSLPELQINNDGVEFTTTASTTYRVPTATSVPVGSATNTVFQTQTSPPSLFNDRNPKKISDFNTAQNQQQENAKLLQALLMATSQSGNSNNNLITKTKTMTTTVRSIEDDIRQFEEDTKLLKALLQATGRDPASLNLPSLDDIKAVITTSKPSVRTTTLQTTSNLPPSTVPITQSTTTETTTSSIINDDVKRLQEDTKLLQALLQVTGNKNRGDMPVISGLTSNVRIASNPLKTSMESKSTTSFNVRPVYTTTQITPTTTVRSQFITVSTLQPTTEDIGISTTFRPVNMRTQSTTANRPTVTTEIPSSSTYSDEEDLLFLKNLKSVLSTKPNNEDPETSLANRVIALAVERSLNEIQVGKNVGTTKVMTTTPRPTTTATRATTTPRPTTTTTRATTTPRQNIPSIEDDIKQFEQDTKLLQALLKATGQDPSKFNIPTLPTTTKPAPTQATQRTPSSTVPYGIQIAVKDDLKNEHDDAKLLQTLIKLQDAQETTTVRSKLAITGHSSDEALKKLIQKTQPAGMMSESTKPSMSLSTEYGNSNDALLAALLKEQGFGPTTASSLDEQIRLAALLNQVVVTPKARRTTTPPPPPPAPRRPILDGLSWLWQQWRDTAPGSQGPRPASTRNQPAPSASVTSSRVNWFGSGPFVGNADERPANRIPLEPPSAVEQPPGRGQLVSAAINVTRAFSQFLGAAIQGAAQTVQNVFRAGQNTYTNGSGGSG
ncbi:mucin-17-like isoform X2 [Pieris brassicae]|uniref:mucin-17-like isoform X2 n=1 Tax=Pieris brassicae TaxID=7116 RepID=UPI001E661423|nr:mucin-17-like isoform X2 [Pieris brassicae]